MKGWLAAIGLMFGCMGLAADETAQAPVDFPDQMYQQASRQSQQKVYRVDTKKSQAIISVYSGGSLAKLGHDHVIDSSNLQGYLMLDLSQQYQADLFIPVARLNVDDPGLRKAAHFTTQPTADDIAGTRAHMLDSVLEAHKFPFARIHVSSCSGNSHACTAQVTLTLHGVSRVLEVPVTIEETDKTERVQGKFSIKQTDFGMKPFSAVGGLLKVKDQVDMEFTLVAERLGGE